MTNYYKSKTEIIGDVIGKARCHPYGSGHVANFVVSVTRSGHTEEFRCVGFGELGSEIERQIRAGQVVSCGGYMKTSPWRDDPDKLNHQLIVESFEVVPIELPQPKREPSKRRARPRRQYGRHARKEQQAEIDFRHFSDNGQPEFNDELPPL